MISLPLRSEGRKTPGIFGDAMLLYVFCAVTYVVLVAGSVCLGLFAASGVGGFGVPEQCFKLKRRSRTCENCAGVNGPRVDWRWE